MFTYKIPFSEWLSASNKVHNNKYDYSLVNYINSKTKVKIICPEHGEFEQRADIHKNGNGCKKCSDIKRGNKRKMTKNIFIEKSNFIHNNKYDYSLVNYVNSKTKVEIICPEHGKFNQIPSLHINQKQGCPKCGKRKSINKRTKSNKSFLKQANIIFDNKYEYKEEYKNCSDLIEIICPKHGKFFKTPNNHLSKKQGCPKCFSSKGEHEIMRVLEENDIDYITQHTFEGCVGKRSLKFDFYLPDYNMCIEYDGVQHFKPINHFGGYKGFMETKKRDYIKNEYCESNNINLIRIGYQDYDNIKDILKPIIKKRDQMIPFSLNHISLLSSDPGEVQWELYYSFDCSCFSPLNSTVSSSLPLV